MFKSPGKEYSFISQLTIKFESIDKDVTDLAKLKNDAVKVLENAKKDMEGEEAQLLEDQKQSIEEQFKTIVISIENEQKTIAEEKVGYDEQVKNIIKIEGEIRKLQSNLDELVKMMIKKKKTIRESLKIIENLDKRIRDVARRILDAKGKITGSDSERLEREEEMRRLEEERAKLLREREMYMEGMGLDDLYDIGDMDEAERARLRLLMQLKEDIEYETVSIDLMRQAELMYGKKWEDMTPEEKLRALLELRGLRLTPSGRIQTLSGRFLTLEEAAALFEGIDLEELFNMYLEEIELQKKKEEEELVSCPVVSSSKSESTSSFKPSTESTHSSRESVTAGMTSEDVHYLKENVGKALTLAIAEITAKQPRDPIHYLGQWLLKYRLNQESDLLQRKELQELVDERERLMKDKLTKMFEEEARAFILEAIVKAEERAMQNQIEAELRRIAMETAMLEEEEEEEGDGMLYEEARDVLGVYNGPTTGKSPL